MTREQLLSNINNHKGTFVIRLDGTEDMALIDVTKEALLEALSKSEDYAFYAEPFSENEIMQIWAYRDYIDYQLAENCLS